MFCTRCGHGNPPDASFCARCGRPLTPAGHEGDAEQTSALSLAPEDDERDDREHGHSDASGRTGQGDASGAAAGDSPDGAPMLVVKRGPNAGSRFVLGPGVTTAGRHQDSDILLDDVTVSRKHAEFYRAAEGFRVRDVGSLNGTYLNRERIEDAELAGSDEVQIGKFRLVFLAGSTDVTASGEEGSA